MKFIVPMLAVACFALAGTTGCKSHAHADGKCCGKCAGKEAKKCCGTDGKCCKKEEKKE